MTNLAGLKIGVTLPTLGRTGTSEGVDVVRAAQQAEALGFDSIDAPDLIVGDGSQALEITVALAAAAAATERIHLGGMFSLPLRPVAWLAAQIQALQHISSNRVLLGVGAGGLPESPFWHAVGVPARARGRRADAALAVLPQLIAGEQTRLADQPGQPVVTLAPGAAVPPVLVGGNSEAARRRAATYGDGWYPSQIAPPTLALRVAELHELMAERGRNAPSIHVGGLTIEPDEESASAARAERESFVRSLPGNHGILPEDAMSMVTASPAEAAERFAAYAEAGASSVNISPGSSIEDWLRRYELVAEARTMLA